MLDLTAVIMFSLAKKERVLKFLRILDTIHTDHIRHKKQVDS